MYVHLYDINGWKALFVAFDVLFAVLMLGGVSVLIHHSYPNGPHGSGRSSEEKRLFRRFANGEIDDDEYRRCRETIRASYREAAGSPGISGNRAGSQSPSMTESVFGCGGVAVRSSRRPVVTRASDSPPRFPASAEAEDPANDVAV
ncbi:hypothetical protein ACFQX6_16175 [Streptosporangium lutulentum]